MLSHRQRQTFLLNCLSSIRQVGWCVSGSPFMLQSAVKLSTINQRRACLALIVAVGTAASQLPSIRADEGAADTGPPSLQLVVTAVNTRIISLDSFRGQLNMQVRVTNISEGLLKLQTSQFTCTVDSKPAGVSSLIADSLFSRGKTLAAGASRKGWLSFKVDSAGVSKPKISLEWSSGRDETVTVTTSVNEAVRRHANVQSKRIGPNESVAIVELHRQFDCLSIEPLTDEFRRLRQQEVRRVVLDIQSDEGTTSVYSSAYGWLSSVRVGGDRPSFLSRQHVRSAVQFDEFYVARLQSTGPSAFRITRAGLFYKSRDDAVAAALRPIYEHVPLKQALEDLTHPEAGIRRAVLEANIDRLTADEFHNLIAEFRRQGEDELVLVAENLHRVALPDVLMYLNELVRDERVKVSAAALRSFARSVSPGARDAFLAYWHEIEDAPLLRQRVIEELMSVKDRRYPDLMAEYTEYRLMAFSTPTHRIAANTASDSTTSNVRGLRVTSADVTIIRTLLGLLTAQKTPVLTTLLGESC
jgi:hypothetical protein